MLKRIVISLPMISATWLSACVIAALLSGCNLSGLERAAATDPVREGADSQRELSRSQYTDDNEREERERARQRGEVIGDSSDDAWIHTRVVANLTGDSDGPQRRINVDVQNGVVTLRGFVESAEQKAAVERAAKETDGVKGVINRLKFIKPTGKSLGAYYA
jgi:osmotically-inducible protein OsmY